MFTRCRNCNTYFETDENSQEHFCSETCKIIYRQCIVCGQYFELKKNGEKDFCSNECRNVYTAGTA